MAGNLPRWAKLDAGFLSRSHTNRVLVDTFGPFAPLVFLAIILECESSENGRATDTIEVYYRPMARACGCMPDDVRNVVGALENLGKVQVATVPPGPMGHSRSAVVRLVDRPRWAPEERRAPHGARLRVRPPRLRSVAPDDRLIDALRASGRPMRGREIASEVGLVYSGSFKTRLARLRREGRIESTGDGYTVVENA